MDTLPSELLNYIFNYLTQHDLTSLSVACRAWSSMALARLYHTPSLASVDQLNRFAYSKQFLGYVTVLDLSTVSHYVTDKHLHNFCNTGSSNILTSVLPLSLSHINLSDCDKLSTHVLNQLIERSIYSLRTAILINCKLDLKTLDLLRLASRKHLSKLDLSGTMVLPCHAIDTPNHLENLIEPGVSQLQELNVGGCNWVDSDTVTNIGRGLPRLVRLSLFWCDQVCFTTCLEMVRQLSQLRHLDLQHIPAVSSKDKAMLLLDNGRLESIEYSDRRRRTVLQRSC